MFFFKKLAELFAKINTVPNNPITERDSMILNRTVPKE